MISKEYIIEVCANEYGITPADVMGNCRLNTHAEARQYAMRLMRDKLSMTYQEIGDYFNRTHATVVHNCQVAKYKSTIRGYEMAQKHFENIFKTINNGNILR